MSSKNREIKERWVNYKASFFKNELQINRFQVMQKWEDNYMKNLASVVTKKGGDILEIGFGLGLSAGYIQRSRKIKSHVIIECHPDVIQRAQRMFINQISKGKMTLINGFWEDITQKFKDESFNGILFDTNPLNQEVVFFHFFPFFKEAYRLLRKRGVFTYFSDEPKEFSKKHLNQLKAVRFSKIDYKICRVNPSESCRYWKHNTILVPIITK